LIERDAQGANTKNNIYGDRITSERLQQLSPILSVVNDPAAYMWVVMAVSVFVIAAMGSFTIV
jgi:hypothetical protein